MYYENVGYYNPSPVKIISSSKFQTKLDNRRQELPLQINRTTLHIIRFYTQHLLSPRNETYY